MGKLNRFSAKEIYDKPLLATPELLDNVLDYIEDRNNGEIFNFLSDNDSPKSNPLLNIVDGVAILNITGALVNKASMMEAMCMDITSYVDLEQACNEMLAKKGDIDLVVANIDSGGGQAFRAFETGEYLKETLETLNVPNIAYVNGAACSGGYALASAFGEIVANPDSRIGSIGVVVALHNNSEAMKQAGISTRYITAGKSKVPFDDDGEFTDKYIQSLQENINHTYDRFTKYVSEMRGLTVEEVRSTEAEIYRSDEAEVYGLIDSIKKNAEFIEYIKAIKPDFKNNKIFAETFQTSIQLSFDDAEENLNIESENNKEETNIMDIQEVLQSEEAKQAIAAQLAEQKAALEAEFAEQKAALEAEKARIAEEAAAKVKAEQLAQIKEAVSGFSFVSEDLQSELSEFLLEHNGEAVYKALEAAQEAIEAAITEQVSIETEDKQEEIKEPAVVESGVMKLIKAKKAKQ